MIKNRMPKIMPMAGWVLVREQKQDVERTPSGIILPEKANPSNIRKGVVVRVGKPLNGIPVQMSYKDVFFFLSSRVSFLKVENKSVLKSFLSENDLTEYKIKENKHSKKNRIPTNTKKTISWQRKLY